MTQDKDLREYLDEVLDAVSEWPEEMIRREFGGNRIPRNVDFRWMIGGTEYTVISHFKPDNAEAVINKVERLLESEEIG